MTRILLVDDDAALLDMLALAFTDAGHEVVVTKDGVEALAAIRATRFDAIVSDVNMPALDGFSLCRKLRAEGDTTPLVLLTSRDNEIDHALGLELGADDFVGKPFSMRILLARISALLRRDAMRRVATAPSESFVDGLLAIDVERLEVRYGDTLIVVTLSEFRLLEGLVRKRGIVLSRDRLLEIVRGDDSVVVERIIDTYVRRLRRKFESVDPAFDRIETVVGLGYRWRER
jgi:DNA-binding response OmpR family regulator